MQNLDLTAVNPFCTSGLAKDQVDTLLSRSSSPHRFSSKPPHYLLLYFPLIFLQALYPHFSTCLASNHCDRDTFSPHSSPYDSLRTSRQGRQSHTRKEPRPHRLPQMGESATPIPLALSQAPPKSPRSSPNWDFKSVYTPQSRKREGTV